MTATLLFSVDETLDRLIRMARTHGVAMCAVFPITIDVEIWRGEPCFWLDGEQATREQVVTAWNKARADRAPDAALRREQARVIAAQKAAGARE